jgi:environmental stress-induced protein Ves
MSDALVAIDTGSFHRQPWANGGGTTTELAAGPDREHWRWRISLAEVDRPGGFSALPGVRRQLAPLDGRLHLCFPDGREVDAQRLQTLRFDGDPPPHCELPDGPGRDFNLMLRDGAEGELLLRPLVDSMVMLPQADTRWFVYLLAGQATLSTGTEQLMLAPGHAAWAQASPGLRVVIEGAGELALVRLTISA